MRSVLVIEDDYSISKLIKIHMEMAGYEVSIAADGECALQMLLEEKYNIILLDLMLPIFDGEYILEKIKKLDIPVIVVSAKSTLYERVKLLRMGADDYIVKPFEAADLLARVEAVLRRYEKNIGFLRFKDIEIDENKHKVLKNKEVIKIAPKEYDLLCCLIKNKNKVLSKANILSMVWGTESEIETRTVDVHIQRLRKKVGLNDEIKTITKVGYLLENTSDENDL